jgi:LysM repeat protein
VNAESSCGDSYTVKRGDTMRIIADHCEVTLTALLAANPQITNPNLIYPGQVVRMPGGPIVIPPTGTYQNYTVVRGDTMRIIATRFGTTVSELQRLNPEIVNINIIYPGQVVRVPVGTTPPPPPPVQDSYIVQRGDTLRIIANRFGTTVQAILQVNPQIVNPNLIYPGQVIKMPTGSNQPIPDQQTYVVQRGDTLRIIAARFGTTAQALITLNPQITNPNLIYPGQIIRIR